MDTHEGTWAIGHSGPKLMSGPSAYHWRRILFWGWVVALGLAALGGVLWLVLALMNIPAVPWVFYFVIPGAALGAVLRLFWLGSTSPREAAETREGYTTLPELYPNVDHLHPRTGEVIRAAGRLPLTRRELRAILAHPAASTRTTNGVLMQPLEATIDKKGRPIPQRQDPVGAVPASGAVFTMGSPFGQWLPLISIVAFLGIMAWVWGNSGRGPGASGLLLVLATVPAILVPILVPIWVSYRIRRSRVNAARPGALVYDGLLPDDLRQASHRLGQGPLAGYWVTVALTGEGLEFWSRNHPAPDLLVRWTDVVAAEPGEARYSNSVQPAVMVEVETDIGRTQVPVAINSGHVIGKPSAARMNELLFAIRDRIPQRRA